MNHLRENSVTEMPGVPGDVAPTPKRSGWRWMLVIGLAVGAWYFRSAWLPWVAPGLVSGAAASTKPAPRPIPVRTAQVVQKDMDLYLNGLGTVTPFKTVTLRSRVDGQLITVAFEEGQMVKEGQLLAQIDPGPFQAQLDQAKGTLAKDEATLKLAKLTLARGQELQKSKSIAQQQIDEEAAMVQQLDGTVQTDEALVANAELQLGYCRIIAPVSGRIGLRLVDQGNIVHANDLSGMAVITQLEPIALVFPISQDEIPRVQKQVHAGRTLTVEAWDRGFSTKLASGKLYALDNQVDPTTGTVKLKAVFDNKDGMLFPNQFVNARLLVEVKQGALVVPSAAVQRGPNMTFVYIVGPDEKVDRREILVGPTEGAETSIETGLAAGDVVVTDGIDKLKKDALVTTREK